MHPIRRTLVALLALGAIASCSPAGDGTRDSKTDVSSHLWELSTKSDDARKWTESGEVAFDTGLFHDALRDFKRAVAADSAFAYGYLRVAQNAYSLDEYRANLERANAFASSANAVERLLIQAENRIFASDIKGGLDSIRKLATLLPSNPRAPLVLAYAAYQYGQNDSARAAAKRAIDLAPDWGAAQLSYGTAHLIEPADLAVAEKHTEIGQQLWPDKAITYDYLGDLRRKQARLAEAAAAYSRQIELSPDVAEGYNQRGHAYTFLGKFDSARADYEQAARLGKGNGPAVFSWYRAFVEAHEGHTDVAITRLQELVQAIDGMGIPEPDGIKISTLQGISIFASHIGDHGAAERAVAQMIPLTRKAIDRVNTPEFRRSQEADIAFAEGRVAAFKGDYPLALQKAEEHRKLRELDTSPTKDRPYHVLQGFIAFGQKRYADAIAELNQGDPDNPYLRFMIARALEAQGSTAEAKALYKAVSDYNFNSPGFAAVRREALAKAAN